MTYEEAARILDPETSREALLPYAYDPQYQQMLLRKACVIAANALESYAALVTSCPEGDLIMPGGEMLKIKILSLPCISYEPPRLADAMPVNRIKIQYDGEELTVQEICKRLERAETRAEKKIKQLTPLRPVCIRFAVQRRWQAMQLLPGIEKGGLSMERLTSWCEEIEEAFLSCEKCKKNGMTECWSQENCTQTVVDRLAEIEDILGNEYDLDRLRELIKADREGRCTIFPCRDWLDLVFGEQEVFYGIDTDYIENPIREITVHNEERFIWHDGWKNLVFCGVDENGLDWEFSPEEVGKTVFLTEEQAESALKAMKEREEP